MWPKNNNKALLLWAAIALCGGVGCAYYSTSAGSIGGIRSVAVPTVENATAEFGVGELLNERLVEAYTRDGQLRVIDEERAEAMLYLRIVAVDDLPFTYTAAEVTEQYRFRVQVDAELVRVSDERQLIELKRLEGWGTYDAALPEEEGRQQAVARALTMVVEEIVNRTATSW